MDADVCPGCQELRKRITELEAQLASLAQKLEEVQRAGKRQPGHFARVRPNPIPKHLVVNRAKHMGVTPIVRRQRTIRLVNVTTPTFQLPAQTAAVASPKPKSPINTRLRFPANP